MTIEQTINSLINLKNNALKLANDSKYTQGYRDAHRDDAEALRGAIEILVEQFELKSCQSCEEVFLPEQDEDRCAGCGEHIANRYAFQEYLNNDRVRGF